MISAITRFSTSLCDKGETIANFPRKCARSKNTVAYAGMRVYHYKGQKMCKTRLLAPKISMLHRHHRHPSLKVTSNMQAYYTYMHIFRALAMYSLLLLSRLSFSFVFCLLANPWGQAPVLSVRRCLQPPSRRRRKRREPWQKQGSWLCSGAERKASRARRGKSTLPASQTLSAPKRIS